MKGYSHNPTWAGPLKPGDRKLRVSREIAMRCVKRFTGPVLQDLKRRLKNDPWGPTVDSVDFYERKNGEVWVVGRAMWASHCYRIESEAARKRILDFMDYVESI